MTRIAAAVLPYPRLSVVLVLTWLLLNAPLTPGTAALALLVGLAVPHVMRALRPRPVRIGAPAIRLPFLCRTVCANCRYASAV